VEEDAGPVATRMFDRRPAAATADPHERVATIVARHGDLLFRVARHYALCADDAHDAVQRALEIYMRRVDSLDPATELAWMKVVVKHESLAVRRTRAGVASEDVDLDAVPATAQRSVEERFESSERVERSAEIMRRLKRDEARALMLKAEGLSYNEIGERLGWTYTKVNRCITEGRRAFMRLYEELETGVECERLAPTLHALAKGTADSEALLELRPHLRNCAGCRATVRALHTSHLRGLSAIAAAVIAPARAFVERLSGRGAGGRASDAPVELHPMEHQQDVDELLRRLNGGESAVQPVAPSVAEGVGRLSTVRINLRGWAETALHRLQSSDLAIGVHAASTGGGGRITSIAALIGICVSGVGAGTYCVATALLPDPKPAIRSEAETAKRKTPLGRRVSKTNTASSAPRAPSSVQPGGVSGSRFTVAQTPKTVPKRTTREKTVRPDEFSFETDTRPSGSQPTPPVSAGSAAAGQTTSTGGFESGSTTGGATSGGEFDDGTGGEFSP
jgi:RNA polymerase sigma factor (sigma-70 family)